MENWKPCKSLIEIKLLNITDDNYFLKMLQIIKSIKCINYLAFISCKLNYEAISLLADYFTIHTNSLVSFELEKVIFNNEKSPHFLNI